MITNNELMQMSIEELRKLNTQCFAVLKNKLAIKSMENKFAFEVGEVICFTGKKISGNFKIHKINKTKADCYHIDSMQIWTLPISGLQKIS